MRDYFNTYLKDFSILFAGFAPLILFIWYKLSQIWNDNVDLHTQVAVATGFIGLCVYVIFRTVLKHGWCI